MAFDIPGLLQILGIGGDRTQPVELTSNDPAHYLGNLVDPATARQYSQANLGNSLLALGAGLGSLGPSRLPVPFAQSFAAGGQGLLNAQKDWSSQVLNAANAGGQIQEGILKKAQAAAATQDLELARIQLGQLLKKYQKDSADPSAPATNLAEGEIAQPIAMSPSASRGGGGWGPHAGEVIDELTKLGASPQAIQAAMANGLGEGGFQTPWQKAWGNENSFGHWQLYEKGELPGYLRAEGKENPQDSRAQARFIFRRLNEIKPGFWQMDDAQKATDIFALDFEKYKGAKPGQRYGLLADAQRAMGGATLEQRLPIPEVSNASEQFSALLPRASAAAGLGPPDITAMPTAAVAKLPDVMSPEWDQLSKDYTTALNGGYRGSIQDFYNQKNPPAAASPLTPSAAATSGSSQAALAPSSAGGDTSPPSGGLATGGILSRATGDAAAANLPPRAYVPPQQVAQATPTPLVPPGAPPQGAPPGVGRPPLVPGGAQPLPPGFSRQDVADATFNVELARLRKQQPSPIDVKIAGYQLDVALEASKAQAQEKAKNDFAYSTAYRTTSGQEAAKDPYELVDATINGVEGKYPRAVVRMHAEAAAAGRPIAAPPPVAPASRPSATTGPSATTTTPSRLPDLPDTTLAAPAMPGLRNALGLPPTPYTAPAAAPTAPAAAAPPAGVAPPGAPQGQPPSAIGPQTPPPYGKRVLTPYQTKTEEGEAQAPYQTPTEFVVGPPDKKMKVRMTQPQMQRYLDTGLLPDQPDADTPSQLGEPVLSPGQTTTQQERAKAPYGTPTEYVVGPPGNQRKVKMTQPEYQEYLKSGTLPGQKQGQPAPQGENVYDPNEQKFRETLGAENAKTFAARRDAATAAQSSIEDSKDAIRFLESGVITGTGANARLAVGKFLYQLGIKEGDNEISNTEAYLATRSSEVARIAKQFGVNPTDRDLAYAERAAAGQIELNETSIRKILETNDRLNRRIITMYNKDNERVGKLDPTLSQPIDMPEQVFAPRPTVVSKASDVLKLPPGTSWISSDGKQTGTTPK